MIRKLLAVMLMMVPAAAHAQWHEATTRHFVVYSQEKPDDLREFATDLERFDMAIRKFHRWPDDAVSPSNRVTVYVVDDRQAVAQLIDSKNVAGFYRVREGGAFAVVPRISGSAMTREIGAQEILLHEYTHHLMKSMLPHTVYPAWFVEGFAELYATARFNRKGEIELGHPPQYRAYGLSQGNMLPAERMMTADSRKLGRIERDGLYGRGWLLSHYVMIGKHRQDQFQAYVNALNAGKPPLEAAAAFGDLRQLDRELERYKRARLTGYALSSPDFAKAVAEVRALSAGESATMDVLIRSRNGDAGKAADIYADARKVAAPYPNDAGAQLMLATAAYYARDYRAADAAADRALAADPQRPAAYVIKTRARMALARAANDRTPETWSAIREIIAAGNKREHDNAELLALYYRSFAEPGRAPNQTAKAALFRAFELTPQDAQLRLNAAMLKLRDGDAAGAREMLAVLAFEPHGGGLSERAGAILAMIDAGRPAAAAEAAERGAEAEDGAPAGGKEAARVR